MKTWVVQQFPAAEVSPDGTAIFLDIEMAGGQSRRLEIPYGQIEWLLDALLRLSQVAYDRSVANGRIQRIEHDHPGIMIADGSRVLPAPADGRMVVQLTGRRDANAPRGSGSFVIDEHGARDLSVRLAEVAEQLRQAKKPS